MADAIAPHLSQKSQELHESILALGVVVDLYMRSSNSKIDDMIFIVHHLYSSIEVKSDELNSLLREVVK